MYEKLISENAKGYRGKMDKKGQMAGKIISLAFVLVAFVVVAVTGALSQDVLTDIGSDQTAASYAANATSFGQEGINKIVKWQPTMGNVVVVVVILGLLFGLFMVFKYKA